MLKNLRNRLSDNKGFSLVELIVVIAIMVILIAILVPNITGYINKSRDVANSATAKTVYDSAYAYQTELIGQNKMEDSKKEDVIVGALNSDGIYKVDMDANTHIIEGGSVGDGDYGVVIDDTTGKITVKYKKASDGEIATYPDDGSSGGGED